MCTETSVPTHTHDIWVTNLFRTIQCIYIYIYIYIYIIYIYIYIAV